MDRKSFARHASLIRSWKGDGTARGFSVTLEVAFRCNVRCVFCSRWSDPTDLSLEVIERVAEDMAELDAGYVSLTGGDPFVRRDIKEIIDAFASRSVPIHINTNGVLLRKYADFLTSRAAAIRSITVSIDSPHPEVHDEIRGVQGTFRRALAGMDRIRNAIPIDLACTLNQKNFAEIEEYAQFARTQGYDFRFQPLHDDGENQLSPNQEGVEVEQDELDGLTERLDAIAEPDDAFDKRLYYRLFEPFFRDRAGMESLRCVTAARLIYFVDPKGDVYPCDTRRDVALGNVYETRLAEIVAGAASTSWRETCRKRENGCWCMYACVAPNNVRYQDLPAMPLTKRGWPFRARWEQRLASLSGESGGKKAMPSPVPPADPADGSWPFVSIVVASYNGGSFLRETLGRLFELEYPEACFEVILVDDASSDGSIEAVETLYRDRVAGGRLRVFRNPESRGVAGAYNRGVCEADPRARYVLKVDNDLLADETALKELVRLGEANPRAGIVGGRVYYHDDPGRIQFVGGNLESARHGPARMETPRELLTDPAAAAPRYLDAINSCMALIRREVFRRVGLFPEFYGRYEYEDYDFAFQAKRLGYGSLYCPAAVGYHAVSLTSSANDLSRIRVKLRARNGTIFMSRFAPRGWAATYVLYHLAKIPADLVRHGHSPWTLLSGYVDGLRAARAGRFAYDYPPSRRPGEATASLKVLGDGADNASALGG